MKTKDKLADRARAQKRFVKKWTDQGLCPFCEDHGPIYKSMRCRTCYSAHKSVNRASKRKRMEAVKAKLSERKTVHEWLTALGVPSSEYGKPLCLLRRLRITCDRYRVYEGALYDVSERSWQKNVTTLALTALKLHQDGQEY